MGNTIRWGILSTANIGTGKVIPAMQKGTYCEMAAIASRNLPRAEEVAKELGIPKAYGSYEELLEDKTIDAVYIPLPNHLHVPWSIKCMEAGKHVLCEKPMALTTTEIEQLIKVRDKTGMKIGEAFMVRSHPQWIKSRELVQSGAIGKLKSIQGFFSYFNTDSKNIRNIAEYGGGSTWDIGCYPINTSRFLFNEEPVKVIALMENDRNFNVDILSSAILQFPSGQAVFTNSTQLSPYQRMNVFGTKKHFEVEIPFNSPNETTTRIFLNDKVSRDVEREIIEISACDQYTLQGDNFSKAILEDGEVPVPLEDTLKNTAVINALFRSATSGKWENVTI
jgi:predicted dehydrogenase